MATTRFGHLDDFTLKNSKVGIGTSTPTEALEVIGGSRTKDIAVTGIASLTSYEGFQNKKTSYTENILIGGGESGTLSGEVVIGAGLTMTVGTGATTGQGSIKSLKVSNTFTPPIGGTNDRPSAPKPGALFYNKDFRTIEYWDGSFWRQVDNIIRRGRAVFGGGQPGPSKIIDYLELSTLGNALYFGDLINARANKTACADTTRGLFLGGNSPSDVTDIDYVTISSAGNGIDFGDITAARAYCTGCNSGTRGFVVGGWAGSNPPPNVIDFCEIQSLGNSVDFGDLFTGRYGHGTTSSPTRAVIMGGANNNSGADRAERTMEFFTMASTGNASDFGDLTVAQAYQTGCSNPTRGVLSGGYSPSPSSYTTTSLIESVQIATLGNAIDYADLVAATNTMRAASTPTRGFFAGGNTGSQTNTIQFISFQTSGTASDFGDLQNTADELQGGCSNGHGGLG